MPSAKRHKAASQEAIEAYGFNLPSYPGWATVMLFYAAIHRLERLFAEDGVHNPDHKSRNDYLKSECSSIWPEYNLLKGESTKARYLANGGFSLNADQVQTRLFEKAYKVIDKYVEGRLKAKATPTGEANPAQPPAG